MDENLDIGSVVETDGGWLYEADSRNKKLFSYRILIEIIFQQCYDKENTVFSDSRCNPLPGTAQQEMLQFTEKAPQ